MNDSEILDRSRRHGPTKERHHETVEMSAHPVVPADVENEVVGGDDADWLEVYRICAAVEVGEVREPGMIWECQVKHEFKRDNIPSAGADKDSYVRRIGDLEVN